MNNETSKSWSGLACGGVLTLDLNALVHNYHLIANKIGSAQMSAVIKANAYGLGADKIAPVLYRTGCRLFFVAQMIEAYRLRPLLPPDAQIAILNDIQPSMAANVADYGFLPVLNSLDSLKEWQTLCQTRGQKYPCFIQVDSGMSRFGLDDIDLQSLVANPDFFDQAQICAIISHLACADEGTHQQNHKQLLRFKEILSALPSRPAGLANSGGIFLSDQFQDYLFDLVRPGLALYGVDPVVDLSTNLRPVVALSARVAQIRHITKGNFVGYGATYQAPHNMSVATLSIGYADGLHRSLGGKGSVFYQGVRLPIIGRISMDSMSVDLSSLPPKTLQRGDLIEIIGPNQSMNMLAHDAGTIAYEILTSLGQRFERVYKLEDGI